MMDSHDGHLLRDVLGWMQRVLPWAALGVAGGALAMFSGERRSTFAAWLVTLTRSCLVGVISGIVITSREPVPELGTVVLLVTVLAFGSDVVLAVVSDLLGRLRRDPGILVRWALRRRGGDP